MGYETTKCSECYYFQRIHGANTCQLKGGFLSDNVVGCYSGCKTQDLERELEYRLAKEIEKALSDINLKCTAPFDMAEAIIRAKEGMKNV